MEYALENGAKYVVLLNNDTRVDPDWLDALVGAAEQDTTVGLCAGQQRTWDGERCIRFVYRPEWAEGEMILEPVVQDIEPRPVAFGSGCCLLARASVLREIGTFDPRYFAGVEDIDLSLRAWIAGYEVLSVPQAVVFHRISASSEPAQRRLWGYRNQLYTLLKNYEVSTLRRFAQPILRRWLLTRNRVALRATCMVLADIHTTVQLRCVTQQTRRCSDTEIFDAAGVLYV